MAMHTPLSEVRVAILGLGLMGGSIALALRGKCSRLAGSDPDATAIQLCREMQALDVVDPDPAVALSDSDLVILASPVQAILDLLRDLPTLHPGSAVVLDIGSTKTEILRAMSALPPRFDPIGGHPICGKTASGIKHAEASLYRGAAFVLSPLPRTSARARALAEELVVALGGVVVRIDAETHDRWVAASSQVPYLVAAALALATPDEVSPVIGPGFVSTSRLASSSPGMMLDALLTNRREAIRALARFRKQLDLLELQLSNPSPAELHASLAKAVARRAGLISADSAGA